ncbi:S41 family peptidase [Salegentibacter chungangensis]|uniref:S41 family peptidase n=1 Tax=Salegentibacter chungangensis TaxID=1335724 RepID=A0ABW3NT83_9FLAO
MPSSGLILLILLSASAKLYSQIPDKLKHSTWEQEGYDRVLDIKDSTYAYYNKNEFSCSSLVQGNFNGRFRIIDADSSHLVLNPGGIVNYHFRKIPGLPDTCLKETVQNEKSLVLNFQSFWHTFNRNYAFFEKRDLDWKKLYRDYLPIVEGLETEAEFALILKEIADKFDDGHIRLDIPAPVPKTPKTPKKSHNRLSKDQVLSGIYTNYLDSLGSYNNGVIRWGSLKNTDIGYIAITDMNDLANYVPDRFQHSKKFDSIYNRGQDPVQPLEYFQDEIAGVQHIMPRILRDLGHSDSIIVDLRFNGGGYETVALELLSYFVSEEKEILSIKAKIETASHLPRNIS